MNPLSSPLHTTTSSSPTTGDVRRLEALGARPPAEHAGAELAAPNAQPDFAEPAIAYLAAPADFNAAAETHQGMQGSVLQYLGRT